MAAQVDSQPTLDLNEELRRIDQRHAELMAEVRAIKPVTTTTLIYWTLSMLVPLAFGAALVKLFS